LLKQLAPVDMGPGLRRDDTGVLVRKRDLAIYSAMKAAHAPRQLTPARIEHKVPEANRHRTILRKS